MYWRNYSTANEEKQSAFPVRSAYPGCQGCSLQDREWGRGVRGVMVIQKGEDKNLSQATELCRLVLIIRPNVVVKRLNKKEYCYCRINAI